MRDGSGRLARERSDGVAFAQRANQASALHVAPESVRAAVVSCSVLWSWSM